MIEKVKMNIVIIGNSIGFPVGLAATTRVRCFAKGLMAAGHTVQIINTVGLSADYVSTKVPAKGTFQDIPYVFCGGLSERSRLKIPRFIENCLGDLIACILLIIKKLTGKIDCLVIYSRNINFVCKFSRLCKFLNIPVIHELCEWPESKAKAKGPSAKKAKIFSNIVVKYADAVIPISHYIDNEVKKLSKKRNIPSLIVPILFDDCNLTTRGNIGKYFLYAGMVDYVDIGKIVIDVAVELKKMGINYQFIITGAGKKESVRYLKDYIKNKQVESLIDFLGYVNDKQFKKLIAEATALIAPLPDSLQSISRFPTKLAYYLASSRPVVTSNVGEVRYYLKDKTNAYIVPETCKAKDFANKLSFILKNMDNAKEVGLNGKQVAMSNFDCKIQGQRLADFFDKVIANY